MTRKGFSLVECLIGLSLFFLAAAAAMEAFGTARTVFARLKNSQESRLAATAALEKIRFDLARAGLGLASAAEAGAVEPVAVSGPVLTLASAESEFPLAGDVAAGSDFVMLEEEIEEVNPRRPGGSFSMPRSNGPTTRRADISSFSRRSASTSTTTAGRFAARSTRARPSPCWTTLRRSRQPTTRTPTWRRSG